MRPFRTRRSRYSFLIAVFWLGFTAALFVPIVGVVFWLAWAFGFPVGVAVLMGVCALAAWWVEDGEDSDQRTGVDSKSRPG